MRQIEQCTGALGSRLLPDEFHNCLHAIAEGSYDFLLTFSHLKVPILLDPELFPHVIVGTDKLLAVRSPVLVATDEGSALPLLNYPRNSFLGRVTAFAQAQPDSPAPFLST
ncbi:MAG: hypothetical protein JOY71_21980 [Acetobacteraceae bacterium]|nr:hypothetical protein [Acetobacteraceae bacterium]